MKIKKIMILNRYDLEGYFNYRTYFDNKKIYFNE
jgi:hypothetical protein